MTKDALPYLEEPTAEKITEAQKLVGELMWLSTGQDLMSPLPLVDVRRRS